MKPVELRGSMHTLVNCLISLQHYYGMFVMDRCGVSSRSSLHEYLCKCCIFYTYSRCKYHFIQL